MRILITSLLLLCTFAAKAQWPLYTRPEGKDSMLRQLANTKDDTAKINIYLSLFYDYKASKKEMKQYAANILSLSQQVNYKKGIAEGYNCTGLIYLRRRSHLDEAMENFGIAKYIFESIGDQHGVGGALCNIGDVYSYWRNDAQALAALLQSKKILESINDKAYLAIVLYDLGSYYHRKKDYDKAIECYKASNIIFTARDSQKGQSITYWAIGQSYKQQKKYSDARSAGETSLQLARSADCDKCVRSVKKLLKHIPSGDR